MARQVEESVGSPGASRIAHILQPFEYCLGEGPRFEPLPVVGELDYGGAYLVPVGRFVGAVGPVVVGEGHPPVSVVPVHPGGGSPVYAETVVGHVLQGCGVPHLDGAGHGPFAPVGMGAVDFSVDDGGAVEVNDGPVLGSFPFLDELSGGLVVLGDDPVVYGIEVVFIHSDPLVRFRDVELRGLLEFGRSRQRSEQQYKPQRKQYCLFHFFFLPEPLMVFSDMVSPDRAVSQ
ncbi:hypothetical protein SDC9_120815 [bioreactor metagenome]|uniref:Uncharacterized protein n=1 Tax=bioreactor metagenome TaxID=1076179 RepID=A0A645CA76_9ZZZZ